MIRSANATARKNSLTAIDKGITHRPAVAARMSKRLFKALSTFPIQRTDAAPANRVGGNIEAETEIDRLRAVKDVQKSRAVRCGAEGAMEEAGAHGTAAFKNG